MNKLTAERLFLCFGSAVFIFLLLCRVPERLTHPSLFMEEGTVYYKYAFEHSWLDALFMPHMGYYSFFANLVSVIAANLFPVEYAPYVMAAGGLLIWGLLAVIILLPESPFKTPLDKILALWLTILIPPAMGRLNINFCHFYITAMAVLILVSTTSSVSKKRFNRLVLFFSGLSGPLTTFLIPVYGIAFCIEKSKERFIQTLILSMCGSIQILALLYSIFYQHIFEPSGHAVHRISNVNDSNVYILWLFNRAIIHPLLGWNIMVETGRYFEALINNGGLLYYAVLIIAIGAIGILTALMTGIEQSNVSRQSLLLVLSFFILSALSFLTGVSAGEESKIQYLYLQHRYFVVPAMCMAWAFVINNSIAKKTISKIIYSGLIGWLVVSGAYMWETHASENGPNVPDWKKEISLWRQDPAHNIEILPPGITMNLLPRNN